MSGYVDPKANTYSRIEFQSKYGTDESCEQALYQLKWPDGFKCPKCGSRHCSGHKSDPSASWRIYEKCAVSLVQYLTAAQATIQK